MAKDKEKEKAEPEGESEPIVAEEGEDARDVVFREFFQKVNKEYGKGTIQTADKSLFVDVPRIPTGVFALDFALGGGVPAGRITLLYGHKSSSKSTTALRVVGESQKLCSSCFKRLESEDKDGKCSCKKPRRFKAAWIDAEGCFEHSWAKNIGVELRHVALARPEYAEQAIDIVEGLLRGGACDLVVIDSIAAMAPSEELEKSSEKDQVGLQARKTNKGIRKWISAMNYSGREYGRTPTLIMINQIRMKIGIMFGNPETIPGGLFQEYGASVIVKTWSKKAEIDDETGKPISSIMCFTVTRNKVSTPHISGEYVMVESQTDCKRAGQVADEEYLVKLALKYGIVKKESSKEFILDGVSFMAESQVVKFLMENADECDKLKKQLMKILTEI